MSKIKVKFDDLEEFADKIGKVERECDEALEALNWHFTSLLANFPGMLPDSIHALEYELRYSINEYKNKLDEAQRLIRLTAAEMEKDEQKMGNKVSEFLLELVGWNDAQRVFSEYDPVTGKKLSFGDRLLAGGFLALSLLPPAKAAGIAGKTVIKGADAGIPALAKTPGVLKKIRNVLDPKKFHQAFRSVYDQVVNAPIALTKAWFDTIKKEIGEIRLPQIAQEAYAGIGVAERTVKDAFSDAKDLIQRIKHNKLDELDVGEAGGATKGTGKETYQHLKDYKNNKYFTKSVEYNAGEDGTGFTYKVYQRGDINWDMVRTKGAKKGRGLTNAEASAKYGLAPILDEAGSVATLHHSQQKGVGPLYEASTRYHNIANAKRAPLHPYKGKLNPFYPMDETTRGAFQKVDSINYWKIRGEEVLGGR